MTKSRLAKKRRDFDRSYSLADLTIFSTTAWPTPAANKYVVN
jgi:hypothetical protein